MCGGGELNHIDSINLTHESMHMSVRELYEKLKQIFDNSVKEYFDDDDLEEGEEHNLDEYYLLFDPEIDKETGDIILSISRPA